MAFYNFFFFVFAILFGSSRKTIELMKRKLEKKLLINFCILFGNGNSKTIAALILCRLSSRLVEDSVESNFFFSVLAADEEDMMAHFRYFCLGTLVLFIKAGSGAS